MNPFDKGRDMLCLLIIAQKICTPTRSIRL